MLGIGDPSEDQGSCLGFPNPRVFPPACFAFLSSPRRHECPSFSPIFPFRRVSSPVTSHWCVCVCALSRLHCSALLLLLSLFCYRCTGRVLIQIVLGSLESRRLHSGFFIPSRIFLLLRRELFFLLSCNSREQTLTFVLVNSVYILFFSNSS